MSTITNAGLRMQTLAIAKALAGGDYVLFDGDGRELGRADIPTEVELHGDGAFVFKSLKGVASRMGVATSMSAFPPNSDVALVAGTIGKAFGKGVDVAMDDQQLYDGMEFEIEEFRHETRYLTP